MNANTQNQFRITSPAFRQGDPIPVKYTCDGENVNPGLIIKNVPEDSKSLALIMEDPDAPGGTFDHWITWNIKPWIDEIKENSVPGIQGVNSFDNPGYGGPCPPDREHRYYFRIFALDSMLDLYEGADKSELLRAMKGHILAEGSLMGRYERNP